MRDGKIHNPSIQIMAYIIAIALLVVLITFISTHKVYTVYGESMEPSINSGDKILIKKCNINDISKGDIVVYEKSHGEYIIHRVIGYTTDINGVKYLYTKGDNNDKMDSIAVNEDMIIGKCIWGI